MWLYPRGHIGGLVRTERASARQTPNDAAATRRRFGLPSSARAYWYDNGLAEEDWDKLHASWLARIKEGVRFAFANIVNNQMTMLTAGQADTRTEQNILLPLWTEQTRVSVVGRDGYKDISQQTHTVTNAIQHEISRSSVSYGPTINVCQNTGEWAGAAGVEVGGTFTANGASYVSDGLSTSTVPWSPTQLSPSDWNASPDSAGHQIYAVQELQIDSWTDTYWTYETTSIGVNGSVYAQSFLNDNPMIMTSIEVDFTRVGSSGDVHMFLCLCSANGLPNFEHVLASSTLTSAQLGAGGFKKFSFRPTLLDPGKRYAWFTVTVGNHAIATVTGNKFSQGSLFWSTDGAWSQGDPVTDFAFKINAAKFASTRTVVEMQPISVDSGMTQVRMLYAGWAPAGTSLVWEIKPTGSADWRMLVGGAGAGNPLVGLPALTQVRAVFVGTTDLMPSIVMDSNARLQAARHRGDMVAVSDDISFGLSTTSITLRTVVDNFGITFGLTPGVEDMAVDSAALDRHDGESGALHWRAFSRR